MTEPAKHLFDYATFRSELLHLADDDYRDFAAQGTPTDYPFLGVRLPYLRDLAKRVMKQGDPTEFLSHSPQSFEELTTQGIVIASLPYDDMMKYFDEYVNQIDNWGTCDTFCNTLKSVKTHRADFLTKIDQLLSAPTHRPIPTDLRSATSQKPQPTPSPSQDLQPTLILVAPQDSQPAASEFRVRVALVCLLCYYVTPDYLPVIFDRVSGVKDREEYYIKMAIAWLLAECFIKFPDETWHYLATAHLPKWTHNKTISKIRDSHRVTPELKDALLTLRQ